MLLLTVVSWVMAGILAMWLLAVIYDRRKGGDFVPLVVLIYYGLGALIVFFTALPFVVYVFKHLQWVS